MKKTEKRTVPVPHKINNIISFFVAPMEKVDDREHGNTWLWENEITTKEHKKLVVSITNPFKLTGKHGQLFDYALSRAHAMKSNTVTFNIKEYLTEAGKDVSWNSCRRALAVLHEVQGFKISVKVGSQKASYTLITAVKSDSKTGEVTVSFHEADVTKLLAFSGTRYVNIGKTLQIKSGQTSEFIKFLQVNGQGVQGGKIKYVKSFTFAQARQFLHLPEEMGLEAITKTISRNVKRATDAGAPKYRIDSRSWYQIYEK